MEMGSGAKEGPVWGLAMRICDFCDRRETSYTIRRVEYLLHDEDQEASTIDRQSWDICPGCLDSIRVSIRNCITPVKPLGQWESACQWKQEQEGNG